MAYLTKKQYDYRRESAAKRNMRNEEIAVNNGMTEEQAGLISDLCSLRHELHTNIDRLVIDTNYNFIERDFIWMNEKMFNNNLPTMDFVNELEGFDILCFDDEYEIDKMNGIAPEPGTDEYDEWVTEIKERLHNEWEELNNKIEAYLREIDEKYNTHFAPTGALRIM